MESVLYWLWLAEALGSGARYAGELLNRWPDPAALCVHLRAGGALPDCVPRTAAARLRRTSPADMTDRLAGCRAAGIAVLTPEDPAYPDRLRALPDLPLVLFVTGDPACLNGRRYAAMVGTRRPTRYGTQACHDLARGLAEAGVVVVSGLADGLDGEAHRAAVEAGCPTVAFLGTAIDKTFPAANEPLRRRIEAGGGAVVSEYPPHYQGKATGTFLARNRLIAGLAEAVCVTEARSRSGTLNTVRHAETYGRPVLAVPGSIYSPTSEGTHALLRAGRAQLLCSAADILAAIGMEGDPAPRPADRGAEPELSPDAAAALAALGPSPRTPDQVAAATGLPMPRVQTALFELELTGAAAAQPGHTYIAVR